MTILMSLFNQGGISKQHTSGSLFPKQRKRLNHRISLLVPVKLSCEFVLLPQLASLHGRQPPLHLQPYALSVFVSKQDECLLPAEPLSLILSSSLLPSLFQGCPSPGPFIIEKVIFYTEELHLKRYLTPIKELEIRLKF